MDDVILSHTHRLKAGARSGVMKFVDLIIEHVEMQAAVVYNSGDVSFVVSFAMGTTPITIVPGFLQLTTLPTSNPKPVDFF